MRVLPLVAVIVAAAVLAPAVTAKSADPVNPPPKDQKVFVQFIDPKLALPGEVLDVEVLFDPMGGSPDKSVPWQEHRHTEGDSPSLEFTAGKPLSLNVTLMFDGYESQTDVYSMLGDLQKFITVQGDGHRPPLATFMWGRLTFQGVIASLDVKYTLFLEDGTPCRATATLHVSEAKTVEGRGHESSGNETRS